MNALLEYLQAFGGRARELATEPQNYLAGLLSSLPDRNNLQGAVQDPEFYKGLLSNTKEVAGGLLTGAAGAPVDIATMMMRPGGYNVPDRNVVGSSNHLAGLLGLDAESTPYKVGSLLPTDPGDAMKYAGMIGAIGPNTWFKAMYPYDWTKEVKQGGKMIDPGPLIDPSQINRATPFPTFGGERESISGIRGFFAKDPKVANRFTEGLATQNQAIFPAEISGARALTINAKGKKAGDIQFGKSGKKFQDAVESGKYDVIYIKNTEDEGDIAVALQGSQIKSAFE